ncbi:hypothetical protein Syun_022823 [Stephania yunnanensis]|uniref:Uncharacterized protein n=1 Tax=Stephania yunnanensis TaxID=152371 RepID=A0AAP0I1T4_9MAGN
MVYWRGFQCGQISSGKVIKCKNEYQFSQVQRTHLKNRTRGSSDSKWSLNLVRFERISHSMHSK